MKRLSITILVLTLVLLASVKPVDGADGNAQKITAEQFKLLIMNYEKNPQTWKFIGKLPCVVDFYADWCGPCRTASPILEELANRYKGKIVVYKVNTDQERELATVFGISGIPAFLWVPMNGNPTMTSGVARTPDETKAQFEKMINEVLLKR